VPQSREGDLALLDDDDARLRAVELPRRQAATPQDADPRSLWHTVPGVGTLRRRVLLDDLYPSNRCPRVQACASAGRLVQGARASHGPRAGSAGPTIGTAQLTWALSDAAVFCRRAPPAGPTRRVRCDTTPAQGQAFTSVAPQWSRAGSDLCTRKVAWERPRGVHDSGRGVEAPDASRDHHGMTLRATTLEQDSRTASLNASKRRGHAPCASGVLRPRLPRLRSWRKWPPVDVCCASPAPDAHGSTVPV
jgi:hypothetical protein